MAAFGVGWALAYDVGIRIYIAEVVAVSGLLFVGWWSTLKRYPMARQVLGCFALWALAIVVADVYNQTSFFALARNLATPLLGSASLLFCLGVLSRNPMALLTFLAATVVGKGVLGEAAYGDAFADLSLSLESVRQDSNFFKVRIDPFLTPAILLLGCLAARRSYFFAACLFALAAVGYFVVDARSIGLVFFLSALCLLAVHAGIRPKLGQILGAGAVAAVLGYGAFVGYVNYTLTNSPNGHNAKQLSRMTNPYNPLELLVQGRSEWLVMTDVIAERPIFGWGSWAVDEGHRFAYLRTERTKTFDYGSIEQAEGWGYIPAHSVVGSAWIWSGFLGAAAMVWLLRNVILMAMRLNYVRSMLLPAVVFWTALLLWHYFFSPPQSVRLFFPFALAGLILLTNGFAGGVRSRLSQSLRDRKDGYSTPVFRQ